MFDSQPFTHKFVRLGEFRYHYVEEGPQGGEPLLLVHGFPDLWYGWRHQIRFLAQRGYRVYAIDTLGYGQSDSPAAVEHYALKNLASHLVAFIDHLQLDKVTLLGHDCVSTPYLPLNTTHDTHEKIVAETPEFAYQLKFAEQATTAKMNRKPNVVLGNVARTGRLDQQELDYYLAQYARSGFQGPLNYYRTTAFNHRDESRFAASFSSKDSRGPATTTTTTNASASASASADAVAQAASASTLDASLPCAHIITTRDKILTPALAHHGPRYIRKLLVREIDADHFVLSEKPDEINALLANILEHFILPNARSHPSSSSPSTTKKPIMALL
ncbi:hypothetical protein DFQ27_007595 [Actinomortierella ambigua]|uniref:AB hydrolase-1 domain-containing protein n=1 Tax=Actinomortierella ambigua TaxID=1343610 RepID=A0A9P6QL41_9FUNG|nr:hypothetical protein DFQ27_007595 [Actinomortierella ambigua]